MGICLEKLPHDECGSSNALQVFEGDDGLANGYCFACDSFVRHPYGAPKDAKDIPRTKITKTPEEIEAEIEEIQSYPVVDLKDRLLRKKNLEYYGIKIGMSQYDGTTPRAHYYPYTKDGKIVRYKCRIIENKMMFSIGHEKDVDLFGWEQALASGAKRLIITEGELDAPSLKGIFDAHTKAEFEEYKPAVCSLPNGAASAKKDLARLAPKIRKHFKEVSFCFDNDEAGEKALADACLVLPEATVITLPAKDANDCVLEGKTKAAFKAAQFNAQKPKNTRLVWLDDVWEDSKKPPEMGISWPWDNVTRLTRGIRKGETYYFGAAPKMGKSEVVNALSAHLIGVHDWKLMLAKPEEANVKTAKLLAGKIASARFHDPSVPFDEKKYDAAGKKLRGQKVCMLDLYQHMGWDTLKADINHAGTVLGVDGVFIDPITNLTNGMNAADANVKLQEIAQELSAMAKDLNIAIFIFCHLKNPDSGPMHERGGEVLTGQFAGSRAMGRSCNYMFGLEGNKDPNLPKEERNLRHLVLIEDREFGEVGRTTLFWDEHTTQFNEVK